MNERPIETAGAGFGISATSKTEPTTRHWAERPEPGIADAIRFESPCGHVFELFCGCGLLGISIPNVDAGRRAAPCAPLLADPLAAIIPWRLM